ncbi:MAG TPA: response regulator [Gemmatimonadales bacterium]|nr:response regulator [Gemmatimonadales bacterium]
MGAGIESHGARFCRTMWCAGQSAPGQRRISYRAGICGIACGDAPTKASGRSESLEGQTDTPTLVSAQSAASRIGTKLDPALNPPSLEASLKESLQNDSPRIVLIAEDEDMVRRMLTRVLGSAGYRTLEARHGEEALRMATFAYPYLHLVITDVVMPELDGRGLGYRLKERFPSLPVLYISAYPADDLFHRGAPAADVPFLQKPVVPEQLLQTVESLLSSKPEPAGQQ